MVPVKQVPEMRPTSAVSSDMSREEQAMLDAIRKMQILPESELQGVLTRSHHRGIAEQLLQEGILTDVQVVQLRAQLRGWHFVDLENIPIESSLLELLPRSFAEAQKMVVYANRDGVTRVACIDPSRRPLLRLIAKKFHGIVVASAATERSIVAALSHFDRDLLQMSQSILERHSAITGTPDSDRTIIDLVDTLLLHALHAKASDVHIEVWEHEAVVRERIDGILHRHLTFSKDVHALVVARIKVMSRLAIDEHNAPQDGKLLYNSPDGQRVDVRVSTSPTTHGEKVVMRLLVSQTNAIPLESLGLTGTALQTVEAEYKSAWGMMLVTGPTGSGKTTSQYALLRRLNREEVNIATIEDPVEYDLPGVNQIQVNEKANVTFATGLRSIVRQDPNIILVGEIRDVETAGICVNAAMTGHLVLSTLHTNDAATAIPRLFDMNVEPFLVSSTVNLIIAQRLVRQICIKCRTGYSLKDSPSSAAAERLLASSTAHSKRETTLYHGTGCDLCGHTGYVGRIGIFEVLKVDDAIRDLIMRRENASVIRDAAVKAGMQTMVEDGLQKVQEGITTVDEVLRVIRS